jgi:glycogen debranching enzyme
MTENDDLFATGYAKAVGLLDDCATEGGFLASVNHTANYRRVWGRDGSIMGLAALLTGREELIQATRDTLRTLVEHQGPHGEIPSNVDVQTGRVSYGGTTGRLDANLWFVICVGQTWRRTRDDKFLQSMMRPLEKVRFLLGCWEYNDRGLLYVPATGDWADEYVHNGYVLYDELLYLQALREFGHIHEQLHGSKDHQLRDRIARLRHLIAANYWMDKNEDEPPEDVYHENLYEKGRALAAERQGRYWLPFFSPSGYGYRFDAFANVLASLLDVANEHQRQRVDEYIAQITDDSWLVPAFHPVITPQDEDWEELQMTFSYSFKNKPYEFQNGGRWPLITGFYVADLARRGKTDWARRYLEGLHRANAATMHGNPWSFPEFLHGETHEPSGTARLGWSAAVAILGHHALQGERVLQ